MREDETRTVRRPPPSRSPEGQWFALVAVHPPELEGLRLAVSSGGTLGRGSDVDLTIDHPTVSRRHAEVSADGALRDLGSHNGTRLNGVSVDSGAALADGAVVRFGDVVLVVECGDAADAEELTELLPGCSRRARALRRAIASAAADPAPVLLCGESGTGKEHLARALHAASHRRGPFVGASCAELPAQLFESALFGHERGAFTGATAAQPGLLRSAAGGTVLLDEIGELPLDLQPKLLRVIQEREVRPVGATRAVSFDARLVAATNRDLAALTEQGLFRLDLYARLALLEIRVPALRERRADILAWARLLWRRWVEARGKVLAPPPLDAGAAEALLLSNWPGNLRELDRLVHRLATRPDPDALVTAADVSERPVPAPITGPAPAPPRRGPPSREELEAFLARPDGSVRAAARHFGRDRRQIYRWIDSWGLTRPE